MSCECFGTSLNVGNFLMLVDLVQRFLVQGFNPDKHTAQMCLLQQGKEFFVIRHIGSPEEKRFLEYQAFLDHSPANLPGPLLICSEVIILEIHVFEPKALVVSKFSDHIVHTAFPVRVKHTGSRAERAAKRAAACGYDICTIAAGFQNGVIGEWCIIQVLQALGIDDFFRTASLHYIENCRFPFSHNNLICVPCRFLRKCAGMHSPDQDACFGFLMKHISNFISSRSI